jgi:hypothetical protein
MTDQTSPELPLRGLRMWALIAEIIAAVAVVVSLMFVGLQLAQANALARDEARQNQIKSVGDISRMVVENPQLADIIARASAGETLSRADQVTATSYMTFAERTWEALYYQYLDGKIDAELWEAHRIQARVQQALPLNRAVWEQRKLWFTKRYREFREADGAGVSPSPAVYELTPAAPQQPAAPRAPN